jgi:hypothetical protein
MGHRGNGVPGAKEVSAFTFDSTGKVYECCTSNQISIRSVDHSRSKLLSSELGRLRGDLGDTALEPYWERIIAPLNFYRFRIAAIPLPFNSPLMIPDRLLDVVKREIPIAKSTAPRFYEQLARIGAVVEDLTVLDEAPLLDVLRSELAGMLETAADESQSESVQSKSDKSICLVLKGRVDAALRNAVRTATGWVGLNVVGVSELRTRGVTESLLAIGALGWFPEYFQTAPRSHRLVSIRFSWTAESPNPKPALISTDSVEFASRWKNTNRVVPTHVSSEAESIDDILPRTNWSVIDGAMHGLVQSGSAEEKIPCKLLMLSNRCAVYVDNRSEKTVDIVGIGDERRRARIATDELEVGMFVLLRTVGGGDLIVPMADKLLGKRAMEVRASQVRWKKALEDFVAKVGDDLAVKKLQAVGCRRANRQNLHNWIGERSIRPEFDEDFKAILSLSGLGSESTAFLERANKIDQAHRSAGFVIRKALLKRVEEINLSQMIAAGFLEIQLAIAVGGSFTAYRVDDISPGDYLVPSSHVGHPQVLGGRVWQG